MIVVSSIPVVVISSTVNPIVFDSPSIVYVLDITSPLSYSMPGCVISALVNIPLRIPSISYSMAASVLSRTKIDSPIRNVPSMVESLMNTS